MKQRAKILLEFNNNGNVAELRRELESRGIKVEVLAVLNHIDGFIMPDNFKFKYEIKDFNR